MELECDETKPEPEVDFANEPVPFTLPDDAVLGIIVAFTVGTDGRLTTVVSGRGKAPTMVTVLGSKGTDAGLGDAP